MVILFVIFHNFAHITESYYYYWGLVLSLFAELIVYVDFVKFIDPILHQMLLVKKSLKLLT